MPNVIVPLSRPYSFGPAQFDSVELRAPQHRDYMLVGAVTDQQPNGEGGFMVVTYHHAVQSYLDRLCVSPSADALANLDLEDSLALEDQIVDFFSIARRSLAKRMASFSNADSPQATSAE